MLLAPRLRMVVSVTFPNETRENTPLRRSWYRWYRASSPSIDPARTPTSATPAGSVVAACCARARGAEHNSAAVKTISLVRMCISPLLPQECLARRGIGPMDLLVADRARPAEDLVAVRGVGQKESLVDRWRMPRCHVTALADERLLRLQHAVVDGAVRVVARHAGIGDRRMLPQVR